MQGFYEKFPVFTYPTNLPKNATDPLQFASEMPRVIYTQPIKQNSVGYDNPAYRIQHFKGQEVKYNNKKYIMSFAPVKIPAFKIHALPSMQAPTIFVSFGALVDKSKSYVIYKSGIVLHREQQGVGIVYASREAFTVAVSVPELLSTDTGTVLCLHMNSFVIAYMGIHITAQPLIVDHVFKLASADFSAAVSKNDKIIRGLSPGYRLETNILCEQEIKIKFPDDEDVFVFSRVGPSANKPRDQLTHHMQELQDSLEITRGRCTMWIIRMRVPRKITFSFPLNKGCYNMELVLCHKEESCERYYTMSVYSKLILKVVTKTESEIVYGLDEDKCMKYAHADADAVYLFANYDVLNNYAFLPNHYVFMANCVTDVVIITRGLHLKCMENIDPKRIKMSEPDEVVVSEQQALPEPVAPPVIQVASTPDANADNKDIDWNIDFLSEDGLFDWFNESTIKFNDSV